MLTKLFRSFLHYRPGIGTFLFLNPGPGTYSSSSSRLQAIPLFETYWLGTFILGMIRTAVGHHYDFEFVLPPGLEGLPPSDPPHPLANARAVCRVIFRAIEGLEPRLPACKASMLTTTPTAPTPSERFNIEANVYC